MNVKRGNLTSIVTAVADLLEARGAVDFTSERIAEFEASGRTLSGVVVNLSDNGSRGPKLTLASTNEVIAALELIKTRRGTRIGPPER